ncbi:MAG TPA: TraR/DksA C4-type zinc finger protein [Mycobacteriales bacterium]|nr:TraR/DksA C4-type zinc finger protein [Mycobacteriales bacterium]
MSRESESAALAAAPPLTGMQRMLLRDLLHERWRAHVEAITDLAVRFHADEERSVAIELAKVRRSLVDVESALDRLESRSYGRCDACDRRIPFEQLEAEPPLRYCRRCQPPSSGSATNSGISRSVRLW